VKRRLPKDVAELVKANSESSEQRARIRRDVDWVLRSLVNNGAERAAIAEVLEGAAQRLRSEAEAEKQAERQRLRSAHVNGKVKP
jgi:uncharacterized membrane-anchored protein YjiN (DUF445 family)